MSRTSMAYVPAVVTVKRPFALVKLIPDTALFVPVAFTKASVAADEEAESFVRVKLINWSELAPKEPVGPVGPVVPVEPPVPATPVGPVGPRRP